MNKPEQKQESPNKNKQTSECSSQLQLDPGELNKKLLEACINEDYAEATNLLEKGADPNSTKHDDNLYYDEWFNRTNIRNQQKLLSIGNTPLHYACRAGSLEFVKVLMEFGADPYKQNGKWVSKDHKYIDLLTPIQEACKHGHTVIVQYLVGVKKYKLDVKFSENNTLLHVACYYGKTDVVKYLVTVENSGLNTEHKKRGLTPLHMACFRGFSDIVEVLVKTENLDPTVLDKRQLTPLDIACAKGYVDIVEILVKSTKYDFRLKKTADDDVLTKPGPVDFASKGKRLDVVIFLAKNVEDSHPSIFNSGLHLACRKGDLEAVTYLVENTNCDLNALDKDGNTVLHLAAKLKNLDLAIYLTNEAHCDPNIWNQEGETVLHTACADGELQLAKDLITVLRYKPEDLSRYGNNSLHFASCVTWPEVVEYLLDNSDCKSNTPNENGDTALHLACTGGPLSLETLHILIEKGKGNPHLVNKQGDTPLHIACETKEVEVVKYLATQLGCDPNLANNDGDTPLHIACQYKQKDVIRLLITELHCDPNQLNKYGNSPLHDECENGVFGIAKLLIELLHHKSRQEDTAHKIGDQKKEGTTTPDEKHSNDINQPNINSNTALHLACHGGHDNIVEVLLDIVNCNVNSVNKHGNTPLHLACEGVNIAIVDVLLQREDCNPDIANSDGNTALHIACDRGSETLVENLITKSRAKCNPNVQNNEGNTPLHIACQRRFAIITKVLLELKSDPNIKNNSGSIPSRMTSNSVIIRQLIDYGTNIKDVYKVMGKENNVLNPLELNEQLLDACIKKDFTEATKLLEKGADPNSIKTDDDWLKRRNIRCQKRFVPIIGETPLHYACRAGSLKFVKVLMEFGADPYILNGRWSLIDEKYVELCTPINEACKHGHTDIVRFLVEGKKCRVDTHNNQSNVPLHTACFCGQTDVVRYIATLENCGINARDHSHYRFTPLHVACSKGLSDIVEILVKNDNLDPTIVDIFQRTVLDLACEKGNVNIVEILVKSTKYDFRLKKTADKVPGPVDLASRRDHLDVVIFLAKNVRDSEPSIFNSGLWLACMRGDLEAVTYLVENTNCDFNSVDQEEEDSVLHWAVDFNEFELASYLIYSLHCDPNVWDWEGNSVLHIACETKELQFVKHLIEVLKCKPEDLNSDGNNSLHIASLEGRPETVEFLLDNSNCKPDAPNKNGNTALHLACMGRGDSLETLRTLIEKGKGNPNLANNNGDIPLHIACKYEKVSVIRLLITEFNCDVTLINKHGKYPLHEIASIIVKILYPDCEIYDSEQRHTTHTNGENDQQGATAADKIPYNDINQPNNDENTALHLACFRGHHDIVEILLKLVDCDLNSVNKYGNTPLHFACDRNHTAIVGSLVHRKECNPDVADPNGNTALHIACDRGSETIVETIITESTAGCNPNVQNEKGNTPLHIACQHGYIQIIKMLLQSLKTDPNIKNNFEIPPSGMTSNPEIMRELVHHGANTEDIYKAFGRIKGMKEPIQPPVKVFIVGNPSAGKTTLTAALQKETSLLQRALVSKKVSQVEEKTAGVIPHDFKSKLCGHVTLFDFAGHREFYSSHAALLQNSIQSSPPIFLLVVDISKSEKDIRHTVSYWLSFLKSQCTSVDNKPHIIVVGSHADILKSQEEDPEMKLEIIKPLLKSSYYTFNGLVTMDCQFYQSKGMIELRQCIRKSSDVLRIQKTISFNTQLFFVYLIEHFKESVAVQLHQIQDEIKKESKNKASSFIPTSPNDLHTSYKELNDRGHILYLPDSTAKEYSWVIIDKMTLLSDVTGTIFAPKQFKEHCQLSSSTGVVPLTKISDRFQKYDSEMLISFLSHMEFCQEIYDQEIIKTIEDSNPPNKTSENKTALKSTRHFFFPGLVSLSAPSHVWEQRQDYGFHFGWMLQCSRMEDFFTTQFLHVLLLRMAFTFAFPHNQQSTSSDADHPALQRKCSIWKNGIYWGNRDGVETLVELLDTSRTVVILMRSQETTLACLQLRSKVINKVFQAAETFCSNVVPVESFIDPFEVVKYPLIPTTELDPVSLKEVAESIVNGKPSTVTNKGKSIPLIKLLSLEPYANFKPSMLQRIFDEERLEEKMNDRFVSQVEKSLRKHNTIIVEHFEGSVETVNSDSESSEDDDSEESVLHSWRDSCDGTYQCLRDKLNEISVFGRRNLFNLAGSPIKPLSHHDSTQEGDLAQTADTEGKLSRADLHTVKNEIWDARLQWQIIGVQLDINPLSLDIIQEENRGNVNRCFTEMLKQWLKTKPQWSDLVEALRSPAVNEHVLAETIQALHLDVSVEGDP